MASGTESRNRTKLGRSTYSTRPIPAASVAATSTTYAQPATCPVGSGSRRPSVFSVSAVIGVGHCIASMCALLLYIFDISHQNVITNLKRKEESFPIPLRHVDVAHTILDVLRDSRMIGTFMFETYRTLDVLYPVYTLKCTTCRRIHAVWEVADTNFSNYQTLFFVVRNWFVVSKAAQHSEWAIEKLEFDLCGRLTKFRHLKSAESEPRMQKKRSGLAGCTPRLSAYTQVQMEYVPNSF